MPIGDYYTTHEAAELLGLSHNTVRDAVRRGTVRVERLARRNLISAAELERYAREVQGTGGWAARKQPGYTPDERRAAYQRAYRQRKQRARDEQGPAEEPDDEQPRTHERGNDNGKG